MRTLFLTLATCLFVLPAQAKYSGGSGTAQDPYQIATAADLIALGETPEDYHKHFILTADLDLDPNLPGRKVFDKAVIAPEVYLEEYDEEEGCAFAGVFDGNSRTISHLTITGGGCLGLFGQLASGAEIKNLGIADVNITGSGSFVGGLVGHNAGTLTQCYSTGAVSGKEFVGGLVGYDYSGRLPSGARRYVTRCYSTGIVNGTRFVGGLVGGNGVPVTDCYSTAAVNGTECVGGLMGGNGGTVTQCYSTGAVSGQSWVGGLVGGGTPASITRSVWDMETSGLSASAGGVELTTAEMMDPHMLGLTGFANDPNWVLDAGRDYPRLAWEGTAGQIIPEPQIHWLQGSGTGENPYRIDTADQLMLLGRAPILWGKHFAFGADIDLDPRLPERQVLRRAFIQVFTGVFDGNGHTISHLTIMGGGDLGPFGQLASGAEIKNLGIVDVNIGGWGDRVGGLVGDNAGTVTQCYSTGAVSTTGRSSHVGGLVGHNHGGAGSVTDCYSTAPVSATGQGSYVGGLVGYNYGGAGSVIHCYSTGAVSGTWSVGGLAGFGDGLLAVQCFWDTQTSGQTMSPSGTGKTTAQMQTAKTFLEAGWDFVGETANGTEDIWWILEGKDYPRLWWEAVKK